MRPLLRHGDVVDPPALSRFLHLGSLRNLSTRRSPFEGVHAVAPNTWLAFANGKLRERALVEPELDLCQGAAGGVAQALRESVGLHLRSDVDTALLLSSGVDSSALAWGARESGQSLHCMTVDLGGGRQEAQMAALTAAHYGHTHEVVRVTPTAEDIGNFFRAMQRPSVDGLNTFIVSRAVHGSGFKVALSGLGGDEATAGYSHFAYLRWLRYLAALDRLPFATRAARALASRYASLAPKAAELLTSGTGRDAWALSLLQRRVWLASTVRQALRMPDDVDLVQEAPIASGRADAAGLTAAEYRLYLQSTLLPDADAFSMASSVELRVPMVDRPFLAAAVRAGGRAGLGKRAFAEAIGERRILELARAPKQGFSLPMDDWMRSGLLRDVTDELRDPAAPVWQQVERATGEQVLARWRAGQAPWSHAWALVVLDQWLRSLESTIGPALD